MGSGWSKLWPAQKHERQSQPQQVRYVRLTCILHQHPHGKLRKLDETTHSFNCWKWGKGNSADCNPCVANGDSLQPIFPSFFCCITGQASHQEVRQRQLLYKLNNLDWATNLQLMHNSHTLSCNCHGLCTHSLVRAGIKPPATLQAVRLPVFDNASLLHSLVAAAP